MARFKTICFIHFRNDENSSRTAKTRMLCNMKQSMKKNHDNVKVCNKNVNVVVEKNYTKAQKYLTMKRKLAFY